MCQDRHILVAQYSAEMTCRSPIEETSPCGTRAPLEDELKLTPQMCTGARYGRDWQTH